MRIDDLFKRIEKDELLDSEWEEKSVEPWTLEKKERILSRIQQKIQSNTSEELETGVKKHKRRSRKRRMVFVLAAVLAFSMLTAFAWENEWDILLAQYIGLEPETAAQVAGGSISIEKSDTQGDMTVTAVTAIGDQNSQYIRIDTDYPCDRIAQDGTEQACYLFDTIRIQVKDRKSDSGVTNSYGSVLVPFNNEGTLSFWLELVNCSGINRDYITLNFQDLYALTTDGKYEQDKLLVKGSWTLEWKNYYRVNSRKYYPLKSIGDEEFDCLLASVEITPISIRIHGYGYSREKEEFCVEKIVMKDETVVYEPDGENGGGVRNNFERESYVTIRQIGEVLDPEQVHSIFVRGQEIIFK